MKKNQSTLALIFIFLVVLSSCKEEDLTDSNRSNLEGTWVLQSIRTTECSIPEDNALQPLRCNTTSCVRYTFNVDSLNNETYIIATLSGDITQRVSGDFSIDDDRLSLCIDNEGEIECTNYSIDLAGSSLTLTSKNSQSGCTETRILEKE